MSRTGSRRRRHRRLSRSRGGDGGAREPLKGGTSIRHWLQLAALAAMVLAAAAFFCRNDLRDFLVDDTRFSSEIAETAKRYDLPPALVRAVVFQESRFDPFARGDSGEFGLMQVLPAGAVAEWARVLRRSVPGQTELCTPRINLDIGCWYLARAMERWKGYRCQIELALCQYNAGESRAVRWRPENPDGEVVDRIGIASTRDYVTRIMRRYRGYLEGGL